MIQSDINERVQSISTELQHYFGERVSADFLRKRLNREVRRDFWFKYSNTRLKKIFSTRVLLRVALHLLGLRRRGQRNALDLKLENNTVVYNAEAATPSTWTNTASTTGDKTLSILQLSDLHIDANPNFAQVLKQTIENQQADITVITGDFKARSFGDNEPTLSIMEQLTPSIPNIGQHCYAILGNHDSLRLVPPLENMGIRCLINESIVVQLATTRLWLSGVDDPSNYAYDDLQASIQNGADHEHWLNNSSDYFSVLLAHSPHVIDAAMKFPFDLYLAGHLHGGQFCWPSGKPVHVKDNLPWDVCNGAWQKGHLRGYTSRGSGTSIIDARFNCQPEVTLHTIKRPSMPSHSESATPA